MRCHILIQFQKEKKGRESSRSWWRQFQDLDDSLACMIGHEPDYSSALFLGELFLGFCCLQQQLQLVFEQPFEQREGILAGGLFLLHLPILVPISWAGR
jgi:hypothetical protein